MKLMVRKYNIGKKREIWARFLDMEATERPGSSQWPLNFAGKRFFGGNLEVRNDKQKTKPLGYPYRALCIRRSGQARLGKEEADDNEKESLRY